MARDSDCMIKFRNSSNGIEKAYYSVATSQAKQ